MNRTARDGSDRHPKPVTRIELFEKYPKARLVLTIVLILTAVCALGYSLAAYLTVDAGWTTIEADSRVAGCADELIFQYDLGAGEASATAESKAVTALYTELTRKAFQLFHTNQSFDGVQNVRDINRHPNEEIVVDKVLYEAFSTVKQYGNRAVYLAPVYAQYENLFGCNDDVETVSFDPYQNEEIAAYFSEIVSFARDPGAIDVKLLEDNKVMLYVSDAYLEYAADTGFSDFIDFSWMKNAFVVDYIADEMRANGFVRGSVSSYDGFVRNLDDVSGSEYAFNLFNRNGLVVHQAGIMRYDHAISLVYLRSYPANSSLDWQHYYEFRDGTIRTIYVDLTDGFSRSALDNLVAYSRDRGCADILMQVMPVYINDQFDAEKLSVLTQEEIYAIYCDGDTILYNDPSLAITDLYESDGMKYRTKCIKQQESIFTR